MYRVFLVAPIFAAVVFASAEAYQLMHRPDSIYIPVVFELLLFGVGYVIYGIINAVIIAPLCIGCVSLTSNPVAGIILALAVAALSTYLVFAAEIFGHRASIMHRTYVLGVFLPLLLTTAAAFYFAAKYRRAKQETTESDT